jgi:hypothetical protein
VPNWSFLLVELRTAVCDTSYYYRMKGGGRKKRSDAGTTRKTRMPNNKKRSDAGITTGPNKRTMGTVTPG